MFKVNSWVCKTGCNISEELKITLSQMGSLISHQNQSFNEKDKNKNCYREH